MYYGKPRENDFYQHLFVASECTNGLPPASSACFSSLQVGQHCGPDEDWSIIAPDEFDGPGVMWRNEETCDAGVHVTDVTIVANFFCPTEVECIHLHRCSFTGNPTPLTSAAKKISGLPGAAGEINSNTDSTGLVEGYFEHQFTAEECSNGLPPVGGGPGSSLNGDVNCVTSLRYAESCGGDHDWDASSPSEGGAAVRWYTSHTCDQAKVAVDYFCMVNKIDAGAGDDTSSLGDHRRIHRCTFKGQSDLDTAASADSWCEFPMASPTKGQGGKERHAGDPAPGFCLSHKFDEAECTNGLPPVDGGDCVVTRQRLRECGAEQDWRIVGPSDANNVVEAVEALVPAGIMWYNALETGPCGEAAITVDYFCPSEHISTVKK
jgi:hypothetical protein